MTHADERPADEALKQALRDSQAGDPIFRVELNRKQFGALPIREQVALRRAIDDAMRMLPKRYRRYRRNPWAQGGLAFLRALWQFSLPLYGLGTLVDVWIRWLAPYGEYIALPWRILTALWHNA